MAKRGLFIVAPLAGIAVLAAVAYFVNRAPGPPQVAEGKAKGGAPNAKGGPFPVAVEVAKVAIVPLQDDVAAIGTLRSIQAVVVRPEISGRIDKLDFQEGAPVKQGQVIVALDDSVPAAELAQAKANLALAESNFNRTTQLEQEKFVSANARDQALNSLRVAQANVQLAQARLAKTKIVAPFSGIIGIRQVSVGDYVKEGQDLVTLEDVSSLKVDFRLPEQLLVALKPGQTVEVASDAMPGKAYPATLDAIDPLVDQNGRAVLLRARLRNADGQLRPGMFVRTRLIIAERPAALTIPEEAIVPVGADQFVFRVVEGKAQRTKIATGLRRAGRVEVTGGLAAEDVVVTAGQIKLRDGIAVALPGARPGTPKQIDVGQDAGKSGGPITGAAAKGG
jgi:membrane fusion protein (multidrug efflux system)